MWNSRLEIAEKRIAELEDKSSKVTQILHRVIKQQQIWKQEGREQQNEAVQRMA